MVRNISTSIIIAQLLCTLLPFFLSATALQQDKPTNISNSDYDSNLSSTTSDEVSISTRVTFGGPMAIVGAVIIAILILVVAVGDVYIGCPFGRIWQSIKFWDNTANDKKVGVEDKKSPKKRKDETDKTDTDIDSTLSPTVSSAV